MRLKHFLSVFLTLLTLSVGQMWGATYNSVGTTLTNGKSYVLVAGGDYAITASTPSSNWIGKTSVSASISGTVLTTNLTDIVWVATDEGDGAWSFKNGTNYITNGSGSTYRNMSCSTTKSTFTISDSKIYSTGSTGKWLQGLSSGFRMYNSTQSGAKESFVFYELSESCTNSVTLNTGSATNGTITYASSVATCGSGDNDRKVTISVAPSSGYTLLEATRPTFNKTSGTVTASYVSGPTWNNSTSKFEYVYRFALNDKGAGNFSITCDALPKYKITYNAGTGSCGTTSWTQSSYQESTTLPTATAPTTCSGWEFEGWCTSSAGDAEDNTTSPGTILKGSYTPTGDITLYAVYTRSENSSTPTTESYGFESTDDDTNWEFSGVEANTGYHKTGSKAGKIARSSTGNSTITFKNKVNVTAFSFQFMRQTTNNNYNVYIETSTDKSSWSAVETYAMSSFTSAETWYAKSHDFDGKTALYVRIKCYTTSAIRWVDDISITYTGGSTTYYMTSLVCCSPLGSINGSVNVSDITKNSATVSFGKLANAAGYEYSFNGTDWTNTGISGDALANATQTFSLSGLTNAHQYHLYLRGIGDGVNNCDAPGETRDAGTFTTLGVVTAAATNGTAQVRLNTDAAWTSSVDAALGTTIYLKATPADNYEFSQWTATTGTLENESSAETTLSGWTANTTVTASFTPKQKIKLGTPVPVEMAEGDVTAITATIKWNEVANASSYKYKLGSGEWTAASVTTNNGVCSCVLTGLTAGTPYTWQVKAIGDNTNYEDGDACTAQNFTTVAKQPASVEITNPTKTTYNSGEKFDATGMVVKVTYNNGDIDNAYTGYTLSPTTDDVLTPANTKVTVSATLNDVTASADVDITVNAKLTWKAAGAAEDGVTYASAGKVVLPSSNPTAPSCLGEFNTFQGWSTAAIATSTSTEPSYVTAETAATADATYYAVFARMENGGTEDASSTLPVNAAAPSSPYVTTDGASWTWSGATFNGGTNGASSGLTSSGSWIQVILPENATEAVSYILTSTSNAWGNASKASLTSGSTNLKDLAKNDWTYSFTNETKSLTTIKLSHNTGNAWIANLTINYKKVGKVPAEWATTCCTEWSAPAISYTVPTGWKKNDDPVSVTIASGTTHGDVTFTSSNTDILTVNETTGAITAVAPGEATVTATWAGGVEDAVKYCEESSVSATIDVSGTVTVTFNKNDEGATGTMSDQEMTYKTSTALSANAFEKTGYSFVGWALTTDGSKAYDDGDAVSLSGDVTLYALWTINSHSVTLTQPTVDEVEAGTIKANNSTTPGSINYGVEVTLTATEVANENDGYAFDSWSVTGATPESTTEKTTSFTMPDNDVTVAAVYHHYTWNLSGYTVTTEPEDLEFTDVETFDKSAFGITANYTRSDAQGNNDVDYAGAWSVKLGDDAIVDGYAFKLADDGKHLTFWVGELKIYDKEVTVTEIPKDQFVVNIWTTEVGAIEDKTGSYSMPTVSSQTAGAAATCKDHNIFIGWVEAEFADEPEGHIIEGGTTGQTASNKTYYAVWAKPEEQDLPAGYRMVTEAPAGGDSVILAAWHSAGYQALQNSGSGTASTLTLSDGIITNPNGKGFKVIAVSGGKQFQKGSDYIHFNSGELKVANSTGNATATLTSLDGGTFRIYGNNRYMIYNGTKFTVTDAQKDATPIYIFKKQAASKVVVNTDYRTDCAPRYTVSFDANGGSGSYDAAEKKEGKTIDLPDDNYFEREWHTLAGWKVENEGALLTSTYTVGDANVTLYAQWEEVSKADVVFKNGGAIVQTLSGIHQTENYNLIAAPAAEGGKQFSGWRSSVDNELYDAEATGFTMSTPAAEVVYTAEWLTVVPTPTAEVITKADLTNGEWVLVTDANQLRTGDVVIIATADNGTVYNKAMGTQGTENYRGNITITKSTDKSKLTPVDGAAKLFLQNGYDEGQFGLYDLNSSENGYLYYSGSGNTLNSKKATIDKSASWSITIEDGIATIKCAGATDDRYIKYNASNPRFSCYGSGQQDVALYKWVKKITTDMNVSDVTLTDAVVVKNGATLTIDGAATLDNVVVEVGGKVDFDNNAEHTLAVNDLTIESEACMSGQVTDGNKITVNGDIYMDVTFFKGATTLDATTAGRWYMISAPFDVNLNGGFINPVSGETMTFGQTDGDNIFDLFEYDGTKRATTGVTGWKRVQGKMKAGTACLIGFNPGQPTTIRLKAASAVGEPNKITLSAFDGDATNKNWNGVANPTLHYTNINKDVQTYNNEDGENGRKYIGYSYNSTSFVVGTAFFVQATGQIDLSAATHDALRAPKRESERYEACVQIFRQEATEFADQMYVRASETASNEYEQGHDMITWNGTTGNTAMIWAENYGQRLAIEEAPLVGNQASYALGIFAPKAGTYRIAATSEDDADLYLTYEGAIIWNLSMGAYELELTKGTTEGYGLLLQAKAPGAATGVDEVTGDGLQVTGAQKVIINDHVYILRNGQMYSIDGKVVK